MIGGRRKDSTRRLSGLREAEIMVEVVEGSTTEVGVEATTKEPKDTVEVDMAEKDRVWVNEDLEVTTTIGDSESVDMLGGEEALMVAREVTGCRGDLEIKMIDEGTKIGEDTKVGEVTTTEKVEWTDLDRGVVGTQEEVVEIKVLVSGGLTGEV